MSRYRSVKLDGSTYEDIPFYSLILFLYPQFASPPHPTPPSHPTMQNIPYKVCGFNWLWPQNQFPGQNGGWGGRDHPAWYSTEVQYKTNLVQNEDSYLDHIWEFSFNKPHDKPASLAYFYWH